MSIRKQRHRPSEEAAELAILQVLRDKQELGITASAYSLNFRRDNSKYGQFGDTQIDRVMKALVKKGYVEQITNRQVRLEDGFGNSQPFKITAAGEQYLTDELAKIGNPLAAPTGGWQGMEEQRRAELQATIAEALATLEEFAGKPPERIESAAETIADQISQRAQFKE